MKNITNANITVIGVNDFGLAVASSLSKQKANVILSGRDPAQVTTLVNEHQLRVQVQPMLNSVIAADLILLTTPENEIASTCKSLSINFKPGAVVAHFCAALDSHALEAAHRKEGIYTCSLLPLNICSGIENTLKVYSNRFHRTHLYGEGDHQALTLTDLIFREIGFIPVTIAREAKANCYAAYIFARDYLSILLQLSIDIGVSAGIDKDTFWRSLQPVVKGALLNVNTVNSDHNLQGPISQGDVATLEQHLDALGSVSSNLAPSYAHMGKYALSSAVKQGKLNRETILQIHSVLDDILKNT